MEFLSGMKKALSHENSVKFRLHRLMAGMEKARSHKVVHASDLMKGVSFCPREWALLDKANRKFPDQFVPTSQRLTFDIGRMLQDHIVNLFANDGIAVGDWECQGCGKIWDFRKRPYSCPSCNSKKLKPLECRFESPVSGVSCGIDLILDLQQPKLRVVEIKTIAPEPFATLIAPLAEHKWRTALYLRLIEESNSKYASMIDTTEATILYASKGGFGKKDPQVGEWVDKKLLADHKFSPFKEYTVVRDDKSSNDILDQASALYSFRHEDGPLPDRVCPNVMSKRASQCSCKAPCWGGTLNK